MSPVKVVALVVLGGALVAALAAPMIAPYPTGRQFRDHLLAPPSRIHFVDERGELHAPFIYPLKLTDRVERRYEEDTSRRVPLVWLRAGRLVGSADEQGAPLVLLGTDNLGRDNLSRLLVGARASLGVATVAVLGALVLGALAGGLAGYAGGLVDDVVMRVADFVLVLPAIYLILALRTVLPLVLPAAAIFALLAGLLALAGWPYVARGVRAVIAAERRREYTEAAVALGGGHARVLLRHLLPATRGVLAVQAVLLLPTFIVAEATLSFVGLGFAEPTPSWGAMLQDAANLSAIADFPWLLSPVAAIAAVVLALNSVARTEGADDILALDAQVHVRRRPPPAPLPE